MQEAVEAQGDNKDDDSEQIYISIPRAKLQAEEYGHSFKRELAFLAVHGFYHLLGYDHQTKEEEEVMFGKQEEVLAEFDIKRGNKNEG